MSRVAKDADRVCLHRGALSLSPLPPTQLPPLRPTPHIPFSQKGGEAAQGWPRGGGG